MYGTLPFCTLHGRGFLAPPSMVVLCFFFKKQNTRMTIGHSLTTTGSLKQSHTGGRWLRKEPRTMCNFAFYQSSYENK